MTHSNRNHEFDDKANAAPNVSGATGPVPKPFNKDMLTDALRRNFQNTVEEGVPDSLMDLIKQLK